jgi:hypothetical protein
MARFIPQRPSIFLLLASCSQERRGAAVQDAEISGTAMLWWCAAKQIGARWATSSRYGQPGMRKSHEPNPESSDWGDAPSSRGSPSEVAPQQCSGKERILAA